MDQEHTIRVLQKHRLATLNTWGRKRLAATYVHAKGHSQIDFVCVRQAVADGKAKTAGPIKTTMAGWRSTGHLPILGSIPHRWTPWWQSNRNPLVSNLQEGDTVPLQNLSAGQEACSVTALRQAVKLAGAKAPEKLIKPELAPVQAEISNSWRLRRRMQIAQTLLGAGYIFVFRFMRMRFAYLKAHRLLKKALRNRKRQRTLQLLQTAETAARNQDIRGLYGVVHMLYPNKQAQKIRLRDKAGNLMSGQQNVGYWRIMPKICLRRRCSLGWNCTQYLKKNCI